MSGMEPILIGSAIGAVTNPKNPLAGALMGGALGGFGGAAAGAGNAAATATMTGATLPAAGTGVSAGVGSTVGATLPAQGAGIFATPTNPIYAATGGSTGLIGSTTAPVTMMDRLKAVGSFAKENPMVGQIGSSAYRSLNEPQPIAAAAPPGLLRGTPQQEQPPQYAMAMPQVSLI
jgi:hypothetical protein